MDTSQHRDISLPYGEIVLRCSVFPHGNWWTGVQCAFTHGQWRSPLPPRGIWNMDEDEINNPGRDKRYKIILWGLVVHFLLLFAVFDVYFASPLDQGMTPVKSTSSPPAKRLVLIVADGLRAEAVIGEDKTDRIPFLNYIKDTGTWGVVHTRVPTESRPGHVAMLAGIYEDPSAIFKGWKANPVNFDSIVPQSTNAWCWGSPDIINLFDKDNLTSVHRSSYSAEMEDFGKKHTGVLDTWVYSEAESLLKTVRECRDRDCDRYFSDGNFFFMHLLGIDTAGHGYKPHSKEYIDNIKLVDHIARNVTALFDNAFQDKSTVFIFTSDHGMTNWGSHGAGSLDETEVPIFAWGAGIKQNSKRQDINQIDIAPLLASLIGINIPANSLGILPVNYLDVNESDLAQLMLSNALQLLKIFDVKRLRTENNAFIYIPFKDITSDSVEEKLNYLQQLRNSGQIEKFLIECTDFMQLLVEGVSYYHNYYQYPVLISISLGFLGWIICLSLTVFLCDKQNRSAYSFASVRYDKTFISALIITVFLLCYKQQFPLTYYLYFSFPVATFSIVFQYFRTYDILNGLHFADFTLGIVNTLFYLVGIELLVYGFFNRLAFTVLMIFVGSWIFLSKNLEKNTNNKEKFTWLACCLVLSVFPCLPIMKTSFNIPIYVAGSLGWIFLFKAMYLDKIKTYYRMGNVNNQYKAFLVQFCCLILSAVYILLLEHGYISKESDFTYIPWFLFIIPVLMIPFTSTFIAVRLIATFFAFAPFYLLVSPNYEVLFSAVYVALLCLWLLIESKSFQFGNSTDIIYYIKFESYKSKNKINSDVLRRAFLFMVFIFVGFFGTGNIASLNSFDPMWVRAFMTVFSPFKMMGLILLKFMVPFIFTCCIFRAINSVGRENIMNMFCIILIFSDLMVLQFLYLITNVGSWLDIGSSLSHFIIMEGFVTILLVLYGIAHLLTTVRY
ncbi:hypothetical protein NQ318_004139 [Aromia moschata]|uniref:GPI ethanolamine phosphate transferase 1 n=1 Tax=Aromia moschata TaxID=1265417 RepID=A0AAV8YPJ6_9CUCU|nr:hypothetical protein NQ318_004139 [Aromia moschata]